MFLSAKVNHSFGKRSFRGTNPDAISPEFFVIDGQQRLNTFYLFLRRPGKFEPLAPIDYKGKNYKIFFKVNQNLEKLSPDIEKPTFVIVERVEPDETRDYVRQGKKRQIPLEFILYDDYTDQWVTQALGHISEKNRNACKENIHKARQFILSYSCVIETIENKLKPQDHYNIFQLLNAAGTDLTIFDLLVAKLNPLGVKLRNLWSESQINYPELRAFDLDPLYILKTISLMRDTANKRNSDKRPSCSKTDLLKLYQKYENASSSDFESDWRSACLYLEKSLKEMKTAYGICNKKYVPYSPMIITLAAIKWWFESFKGYHQKYKVVAQKKIKNWFIGSILSGQYESRTDNKISEHYDALCRWLGPSAQKRIPTEIDFAMSKEDIIKSIRKIESSADAKYKFVISLPLMNNAKDIYSNEFLPNCELHDHHIFPNKFLRDNRIEDRELIHRISNRMLITGKTNDEILKQDPAEYLKGISQSILKRHFISKEIVLGDAKIDEKYEAFCQDRMERIRNFIFEKLNE